MSQSTASQLEKKSPKIHSSTNHSDKRGTDFKPENSKSKIREPSFEACKKSDIKNNALIDSPVSERTSKIKFLDDQLFMEGKPMTPPSKKLASPNRIIPRESECMLVSSFCRYIL
jgi:hypothetical protein